MNPDDLFGVLNINKPAGMTSRKAVNIVVPFAAGAKVGHAGTLDPMATGVLVVCVGRATRLIRFVQQQSKEYRACFLLGKHSDTDDITGNVTDGQVSEKITAQRLNELLPHFLGKIEQIPPQFSAVHVDGRRAYRMARRGEQVELKPRPVEVHRISLSRFNFPEFELEIECGSGTYIRSIGRDIGEMLGCGAVMSRLVRTRIGPFCLDAATEIEQLDRKTIKEYLLPAETAVVCLPRYVCREDDLEDIRVGRSVHVSGKVGFDDEEPVAIFTPDDQFACVAIFKHDEKRLAPKQVFLAAE